MAKRAANSKDKVPITLRLDSDIHEALKKISAMEMRSLNTQIEYFLRESVLRYEKDVEYYDDSFGTLVQRIVGSIGAVVQSDDSEAERPNVS